MKGEDESEREKEGGGEISREKRESQIESERETGSERK